MTEPAAAPHPSPARRIGSIVEHRAAALLGVPRIAMAHRVWNRYDASSGPLLARGLAFTALFTLVPALVLIASIAGLFVGDPATRAQIAAFLAAQFPPLADVLANALDSALAHAGTFSVVGTVILAWSASGLVRDLDGAFGSSSVRPGSGGRCSGPPERSSLSRSRWSGWGWSSCSRPSRDRCRSSPASPGPA